MSLDLPKKLHPLARKILQKLSGEPSSATIIIGGGVALQHHCDFRETSDIDAWWNGYPSNEGISVIENVMEETAKEENGKIVKRSWGDTVSYDLLKDNKKIFSFQIALRDIQLEEPVESKWPPIKIETLKDNLASKIVALVNRGAPRDFLDIYSVCQQSLVTPQFCWQLWQAKNPGKKVEEAKLRVLDHLEQIAKIRPLETIKDQNQKESAQKVRKWVQECLVKA